jgi:hypothetical protein
MMQRSNVSGNGTDLYAIAAVSFYFGQWHRNLAGAIDEKRR